MQTNKNKKKYDFDILVVGGGPAGASAASVFVKKGFKVGLIDGGNTSVEKENILTDFETTRKENALQHEVFLSKDLSGINLDSKSHSSSQTSGVKKYVTNDTEHSLPVEAKNVEVFQTLAKGGLTEVWGANCDFFSDAELQSIGLPPKEVQQYYQQAIDEVGISGLSRRYKLQPPAKVDDNAKKILSNYQNKRDSFRNLKLELHKPILALLTKKKKDRQATQYKDMDYWTDTGKSVYRTRYTIEKLQRNKNFNYIKGVVSSLEETNEHIQIFANENNYKVKYVVLAAGAINTSRILIKSFNLYNLRFPFLTKYHIISACILLSNIGKKTNFKKHSFCQLIMSDVKNNLENFTYTQFYSYKSLLLHKLLKFSKLPFPESLGLLSLLSSSLVLADTRLGNGSGDAGYCVLEKNKTTGGDIFKVVFKKPDERNILDGYPFKSVIKGFKNLDLLPLKHIFMPYGSTAHYSGILGNFGHMNNYLKIDVNGKLERASRVYIADASAWNALPAKPPTLTIMANSLRISHKLSEKISSK